MYSLGIIGGADGPTAIIVSGDPTAAVALGAIITAAIIGGIVFVVRKIKKK